MDGDGRPDFVDSENQTTAETSDVWTAGSQQVWKVYLNTGTGFAAAATDWAVPESGEYDWKIYESYSRHAVIDINGDGMPDFVDSEDEGPKGSGVWTTGSQRVWKVYLNNGTGFDATAADWPVPESGEYDWKLHDPYSRHTVSDLDGDGYVDFLDTENQESKSSDVWTTKDSQQSWMLFRGQ